MLKMLKYNDLKKYYSGKKVLITGHTGFKGSYMCVLLRFLGAKVYGYSLKPEKGELYDILTKDYESFCKSIDVKTNTKNVRASIASPIRTTTKKNRKSLYSLVEEEIFADIRDTKKLAAFVKKVKPDYIIHMAAQPLVLRGYKEPAYTYDVNVMGTVSLMEAIRMSEGLDNNNRIARKGWHHDPVSILNVTTDKVYENNDLSNYAFKENDKLCGRDPYANSKSCSELVTYAYKKSFFNDEKFFRVSTARAGNVIGGGDLNKDRIIPDCFRAIASNKDMYVRNPGSVRPYQFVLEPLLLYLNILAYQKKDAKYAGSYNIGPDKKSCLTTKELVEKFFGAWKTVDGDMTTKVVYNRVKSHPARHEAAFLRLDNNLIKKTFNYREIFNMKDTMQYTTKVYRDMLGKRNMYMSIIDIIESVFN